MVGAILDGVAPFRGAWIEIAENGEGKSTIASLPLGERGLKCIIITISERKEQSLPLGERGLKLTKTKQKQKKQSRSL